MPSRAPVRHYVASPDGRSPAMSSIQGRQTGADGATTTTDVAQKGAGLTPWAALIGSSVPTTAPATPAKC